MSSRDTILRDLRRNAPPTSALPPQLAGVEYADPAEQFAEVFAAVGGQCIRVQDMDAVRAALPQLDIFATARTVASLVAGIESRSIDSLAVDDPHQLAELDLAILPASLGVAENAAVWIPGSSLGPQRAIFVIAQHVVLVLRQSELVCNMHQAYERVPMERPGFGLFLSGPSKTADIEQSLVIGAQGARSCILFLLAQ